MRPWQASGSPRGVCYFISDDAIRINDRVFRILGQTKILIPGLSDPITKQGDYISILVILEIVILAVAIYIAHSTRFGRTVYAIGGNEQSARLMGLPVNSTKMLVYTINGFCSALAGITLSIYVMSGHGSYATNFEMTSIAAVVIGGTMLSGGTGYVFGTLFGRVDYRSYPDPDPVQRPAQLVVDQHRRGPADLAIYRRAKPS